MEDNLKERGKRIWAQGYCGTNSKRPTAYIAGVHPEFISRGESCYLFDTDGKKYVDFVSALGTNILGYNHRKITEAVKAQVDKGSSFTFPHYLEIEVAEQIREMIPCAQKMRFMKTGNEATLAAVRIARASTKRTHIISRDYHGHGDLWTSMTKPAIGVTDGFMILPFSELYLTESAFGASSAVIVEPISLRIDGKNQCQQNREVCNEHGMRFIFDEIITGFRVPKYCVANWWNIQPDIICLGKALANGYPLAVVAGKEEVMDCGEYFISSTYSGEAISLAAAKATLLELQKADMDGLYFYANRFMNKLNEICKEINVQWEGYGTRAQLNLYEEPNAALFIQEACKAGYIFGRAFFFGFAHLEARIEETTLNIMNDIVGKIRRGEVKLEGKAPTQTFKR